MTVVRRRPVAAPAEPPTPSAATTPPPRAARARTAPRKTPGRPSRPAIQLVQPGQGVNLDERYVWEYVDITDIVPYEYNPRDNAKAIPAVANSIRTCGFVVPCVIDANNVLVAGHTRLEAAKLLGMVAVPCLRATHMNQEQINAFRLIDNKVSELASWDFDMLAGEFGKLEGMGIDFTRFGWSQEEVDCLSDVVAAECLTQPVTVTDEQAAAVAQRRAPVTARLVLGEFVFFIPAATYRTWAEGIRQLCDFNEDAITLELKRRLGIPIV